jgi:hypothetical protein
VTRFGLRAEVELLVARRDLRQGDLDEAIARLQTLAPLPGALGRTAGGWLAVAYLARGEGQAAEAAARRVLSRDPEDVLAKHVLGKLP